MHAARAGRWTTERSSGSGATRGLRVPQRRRRKRLGSSTTPPPPKADAPNRVWAVDFQFDATSDGRPIKLVSIIDEHTRECLTSLAERSVTADVHPAR
jgi:putative transposase